MVNFNEIYAYLDVYITQQMHASIPGLALAIVSRDQILHVATYGHADLATSTPVTTETLFEIGSISKSFTSSLVLQQAEQGRLELAAPIRQYLPWLDVPSSHPPFAAHHLMSHTAGLIRGPLTPGSRYDIFALRETVAAWPPGERYYYSNVGYQVLGYLLEALLDQPYSEILRQQLLLPLGMEKSEPVITHAIRPRLATGYMSLYTDRPLPESPPLVPAPWCEYGSANGSIAATVVDMAAYARMLLNRGVGSQRRILSEASFQLLSQPIAQQGWGAFYGYGLNIWDIDHHTYLEHGGTMIGFAAELMCDMDAGVGVILLTNAPGWVAFQLWQMAEFILRCIRSAIEPLPRPVMPALEDSTINTNATEYVGLYRREGNSLEFIAEEGQLKLQYKDTRATLVRRGVDTFYIPDVPELDRFLLCFGRSGDQVVDVTHGSDWYVNEHYIGPGEFAYPSEWEAYPGHYRSHTPWMSDFRIILRKGLLYVVYWWGQEVPLVPAGSARFQVGEGGHPSEVIVFDGLVAGKAQRAQMDGCYYYRFFTP